MTHIKFGQSFNQPVILPKHLKVLLFRNKFNNKIILPKNIKRLTWETYSQPVVFEHPIEFLYVCYDIEMYLIDYLPNGVQELCYGECDSHDKLSENLPNDVKHFRYA